MIKKEVWNELKQNYVKDIEWVNNNEEGISDTLKVRFNEKTFHIEFDNKDGKLCKIIISEDIIVFVDFINIKSQKIINGYLNFVEVIKIKW